MFLNSWDLAASDDEGEELAPEQQQQQEDTFLGRKITDIQAVATRLVKDYLKANPACDLHINSFNYAIKQHIPHIIEQQRFISWVNPRTNVEYQIQFSNVFFKRPWFQEDDGYTVDMTPLTCIERKLNYLASANCTAVLTSRPNGQEDAEVKHLLTLQDVTLFQFPIIVGSSLCHTLTAPEGRDARLMDNKQGGGFGCFIIKGNEKVMIMQEKLRGNIPIVRVTERYKDRIKKVHLEFRSCHEMKMRTTSTLHIYLSETKDSSLPKIEVQVQFLSCYFGVCGVFSLLRCTTTAEVLKYLLPFGEKRDNAKYVKIIKQLVKEDGDDLMRYEEHLLNASSDLPVDKTTNKTAAEQAEAKRAHTVNIMRKECFPHVEEDFEKKRRVFGFCVRRILRVYLGLQKEDDRDSKVNIRSTDCGVMFSELLRQQFTKQRKSLIKALMKETLDGVDINGRVQNILCSPKNTVTQRLITAVNNGNFASNTHEPTNSKKNVTQQLTRPNFLAVMSHLRKESKPINRDGKSTEARQLDPHSWGFTCSTQTPEGNACGLLSTVCMLVSITTGTHSSIIIEAIERLRPEFENVEDEDANFLVVNGIPLWRTARPQELAWAIRDMRTVTKELPYDIEVAHICYDKPFGEVRVNCDIGNHVRPVLRTSAIKDMLEYVEKCGGSLTIGELWRAMLDRGVLEYVGPEESVMDDGIVIAETFYQLAEDPDAYSHVEIDAAISIFGPGGTTLSYPEMNQGPRNTYQCAMSAQAMSAFTESGAHRMETQHLTLNYPQKPIGSSVYAECLGEQDYPKTQVAVVAIAPFFGSNADDGKTVNLSSSQRGFGHGTIYRTYKSVEHTNASNPEFYGVPDPSWCTNMKVQNYSKLLPDGVPAIGTKLSDGDIVIGKYKVEKVSKKPLEAERIPNQSETVQVITDRSIPIRRHDKNVIVDRVQLSLTSANERHITVQTRKHREIQCGDKLTSQHGQKGVTGMLVHQVDLPFVESTGIPADLYVNMHGYPSRMTAGEVTEMLNGKVAAMEGKLVDTTPFRHPQDNKTWEMLLKCGFEPTGKEYMRSGITGERYEQPVMIGLINIQQLKQMAEEKIHSRQRGRLQEIKKQPTEGKSNDGGLRFGEMERDAVMSQGASMVCVDRLCLSSDACVIMLCDCGNRGTIINDVPTCISCENKIKIGLKDPKDRPKVEKIVIPTSLALLVDTLPMNMGMKFYTSSASDEALPSTTEEEEEEMGEEEGEEEVEEDFRDGSC